MEAYMYVTWQPSCSTFPDLRETHCNLYWNCKYLVDGVFYQLCQYKGKFVKSVLILLLFWKKTLWYVSAEKKPDEMSIHILCGLNCFCNKIGSALLHATIALNLI